MTFWSGSDGGVSAGVFCVRGGFAWLVVGMLDGFVRVRVIAQDLVVFVIIYDTIDHIGLQVFSPREFFPGSPLRI